MDLHNGFGSLDQDPKEFGALIADAAKSKRYFQWRRWSRAAASQLMKLSGDQHGAEYWQARLDATRNEIRYGRSSLEGEAGKWAGEWRRLHIEAAHARHRALGWHRALGFSASGPAAALDGQERMRSIWLTFEEQDEPEPLDEGELPDLPSTFDEQDVAAAADSLNHELAALFIELGPPPTPTEADFAPVGNGDGGVQA